MELIDFLIQFFTDQNLLFKLILGILSSLYLLFAVIILIQVRNLNRIVNQISFSPIFSFLAWLHMLATLAILLATVIFL